MRAVLLDAFGTLVALEPPAPRLRLELKRILGVEVGAEAADAAIRAEISFYLEHHLEGADARSLDRLRDRCASVISDSLALGASDPAGVREALLASLRFRAYPDAAPALEALRAGGVRLIAASNWDCSLPQVLADAGLAGLLDGTVSSATVGAAKPDTAVFEAALALASASAPEALHVGDSPAHDVAGARAAGIRPVLLDRGDAPGHAGIETIGSLGDLPSLVLGGP